MNNISIYRECIFLWFSSFVADATSKHLYEIQIDSGITLDTEGQVTLIVEQRRSMPPDPIYSMPACLASLLPVSSESPCLQTAAPVVLRG